MKLKDSTVNIYGLHPAMQIANAEAAVLWDSLGQKLVITSANDARHGPGTLHDNSRACDYRTRYFKPEDLPSIAKALHRLLGADYDVVIESTHIHVEYDPKDPKKI